MLYIRIFIIIAVTMASTNCIVMRKKYSRKNQCSEELNCKHATEIAAKLSKLSLLPDFVTQTLLLLEDLMKEMENELQRSAIFLMDKIEPTCHSVEMLQEIIKKKMKRSEREHGGIGKANTDLGRGHAELGMDIEPFDSDKEETINRGKQQKNTQPKGHNYYNENGEKILFDDYNRPTSRDDSNWLAANRHDQQWSSAVLPSSQGREYGNNQKWTPVTEKSHSWSRVDKKKQFSDSNPVDLYPSATSIHNDRIFTGKYPEDEDEQSAWSESSSFDRLSGSAVTSQSKKKLGAKEKSKKKLHSDLAKGIEPLNSFKKEPVCRGINKSSPFWVPGLDEWCQKNCASGYCPHTHCIC